MNGLQAWEERKWSGKINEKNNIKFEVTDEIPRCSATNLQPNSDKVTINLPNKLKKLYDHINMGIFLIPQNNGNISVDNKVIIYE